MDILIATVTPKGFRGELTRIWIAGSKSVEIIFSGFTGGWGIGVCLPKSRLFETNPAYATLAHIPHTSQAFWGSIAISIALMRIIGAIYSIYPLRLSSAVLGCLLWAFVVTGIYLSDPCSPGVEIFGWYTLVCFVLVVRLLWGRGAGES